MDFKTLKYMELEDDEENDVSYIEEIIKKRDKVDMGVDWSKGRKRNKRRKVNTKVYDLGE